VGAAATASRARAPRGLAQRQRERAAYLFL
jgi:hypothetical protein